MVHDHEEGHPNARKRSYPFIQWVNPGSSPPRKKSPDRDQTDESFPPSLPSPPLQSNKYKNFKQDLDRFGGRLKPQNNGLGRDVKVEEKVRVRKTSWAEAGGGKDCERILCSKPKHFPSHEEPVTKVSKLNTGVSNYKKGYSEFLQTSEKKKKEKHVHKARENEMHVSSSGQDYDAESVKSASFDDDEPQATKRPKYSVEIREVAAEEEEEEEEEEEREYRPNIAESIKLRKPSESRRNKSESYDESDARTIKKILSSTSILDDKRSSLTNNCRLTNRISSPPYMKKSTTSPPMTGTKIKMIPRFLEREKEGGGLESKLYNIQIPQSNGGDGVHASSKDRNHNKVKDNGYDSRKVTISNIAGEVKYKKACLPQPRPSSTVVSSSTEVNNDEETEEDDEHDGHDDSDKEQQSSGDGGSGRVGLQSSGLPGVNGGSYGLGSRPYWPQHKDRPTPYSRDNHNGHSLKQVCRIKKFK